MKKSRQNGFVLIVAITSLTLVSISILILSQSSRLMLLESKQAFDQSYNKNLIASGLAWAKENIDTGNKAINKTIELDTSEMDIRNSKATITVNMQNGNEAKVTAKTSRTKDQSFLFKL